eukprot:10999674-Alexandrium_andersonii.AAC.1
MLARRSPVSLCSSTARSSTYVGVGPPVNVSTAKMTGSKPTAQRNGFTVSYTHLTLPTICSV